MSKRGRLSEDVVLVLVCLVLAACSIPGGSGLEYREYPSCASTIPVWLDGLTGSGAAEMEQALMEELLSSGCFTAAPGMESGSLRLRGSCRTESSGDGGGGDVTVGGVGVKLGKKTKTWTLSLSLQEVGGSGRPFIKTVDDEVSATGMDVAGSYGGEGGSTSGSAESADVGEARRNVANNMVVALINHLKSQGRL